MLDYYKSARINYIEKRCNEYNLNLEVHKIITEDGYINTAFRIRNLEAINNINKENNIYTSNQYPVIINHGLLDNCYTFLVLNRDKAIPYVLADLGYDVWLTNNRGSTFSYEHINSNKIDSNMDSFNISSDYWEFSFYEIAKYDLIANIEYIKKISNKTKVNYVGHSQGGFQVLLSYTINYVYLDNSINKFVSLGTVPKFIEIKKQFPRFLYNTGIVKFMYYIGIKNMMSVIEYNTFIFEKLCSTMLPFCQYVINSIIQKNPTNNINYKELYELFSYEPGGTSTKNLDHWLQVLYNPRGDLLNYDYGNEINLIKYGREVPDAIQIQKLRKIKFDSLFIHGKKDPYVTFKSMEFTRDLIPQASYVHIENYNHLDYLWATNSKELVVDEILKFFK